MQVSKSAKTSTPSVVNSPASTTSGQSSVESAPISLDKTKDTRAATSRVEPSDRSASHSQDKSRSKGQPIPVITSTSGANSSQRKFSACVLGDSMTKILSPSRMSDETLEVKVKSHPGGRIKTIEDNFKKLNESNPEYVDNLDAVIFHVGTNDIADSSSSGDIVKKIKDSIYSAKSVKPNIKVIVSSIIPRKSDKRINDYISSTNNVLEKMCKENDCYFLDNSSSFLDQGVTVTSLYRDHIHLNPKGGKILGTNILTKLRSILGLRTSNVNRGYHNKPNFYNGRSMGRNQAFCQDNRGVVFMPVPQHWMTMGSRNPWGWY